MVAKCFVPISICYAVVTSPWNGIDAFNIKVPTSGPKQRRLTTLSARSYRPFMDENDDGCDELSKDRKTDRPTQTRTDTPGIEIMPSKPKIVVLGATGMIGRHVVRQLLELNIDATIVAFVRDYDKACRVLYDDLLVSNRKKKGPMLQIIQGNLVPPEQLPGYSDEEEENEWRRKAESAALFYSNTVKEYDNREGNEIDPDEALEEAIKGCTTIVSCVGDIRPTNAWTDLLERPLWRLFRHDVSNWCKDPRHPFYVHFQTTKRALKLAEKEQLRREAAISIDSDDEDDEKETIPRIRFIRISDLCVAQPPWQLVPILTNALHSMVFRYQDMAERELESSTLIDTVTIRPGDLVDDERDVNTTALQVNPSGTLPSPARVGREDVAALAVAAALFNTKEEDCGPFHYTLACRWVSENMGPYPAQGKMCQGFSTATLCMQAALKKLRRKEKQIKRTRSLREKSNPMVQLTNKWKQRKIKPYGIFVALPVYLILSMMARSLLFYMLPFIPGVEYVKPYFRRMSELVVCSVMYLFGQLHGLLQGRIPSLWKIVFPRRYSSNYISF